MRLASALALSAAAIALASLATPADAQGRRYVRDQSERITIIDENGRARTRITVRPRSYLDGGTEVVPGERKFMDYAQAPTYGWLAPTLAPIYRDFGPGELAPLLQARGIGKTILVQAAPTFAETLHLLRLAGTSPFVAGVVGWVDFDAPDAAQTIARVATEHPLLVGLRPMLHDIADENCWVRGPEWCLAYD